jgi:hypothetical protein
MAAQIFFRRDQLENLLVATRFAHKGIEKFRAFVPPMAEQLGVVRRDDERRSVEDAGEFPDLCHARFEKMARVLRRRMQRRATVIDLLVRCAAGNAEILYAGETPMFRRGQMRFHVVEIQVESNVAVKIAIAWSPG